MLTLTFDGQVRYRRVPGFVGPSPLFEVALHWNENSTPRFPALLDTGSRRTVFQSEFADSLGIDNLIAFPSLTIRTAGGLLPVYLVDVELEIVLEERNRFGCQVGFARIPRNILGRDIVFSKYMLAFEEQAQLIYHGQYKR